MENNRVHQAELISPSRKIGGVVEIWNNDGTTLLYTFSSNNKLKGLTISKMGEKKFFGYGVTQEIEVQILDKDRSVNIEVGNGIAVMFTALNGIEELYPPSSDFIVTDTSRNENTNELTIKGTCYLKVLEDYTISNLNLEAPYTIKDVVNAIVKILKYGARYINIDSSAFDVEYDLGANFDGTETLREALNYIAEVTQTIYYTEWWFLYFKKLDIDGAPVLNIAKSDYFTLESQRQRTLSAICSANELGDNTIIESEVNNGETQYVRDNPFWEMREDIVTLLEESLARVDGLTIVPYTCKWRGNYLLQIGDKIGITAKDDSVINSYYINDTLTYNGGLVSTISLEYDDNEGESADNPVSLGDKLKQTFARVDKANQNIEIVAGEVSSLSLTTNGIYASVTEIDDNVAKLTSTVNAKVGAEDVNISIQKALEEGINKVETSTGFTFNENGLHISKSNSEINTSITEDGMSIKKQSTEVLKVDNEGVKAIDLHATTYLIIGKNSRLEDYNSSRTGCFWIGG